MYTLTRLNVSLPSKTVYASQTRNLNPLHVRYLSASSPHHPEHVKSQKIKTFIQKYADLMEPQDIHVINGSEDERKVLLNELIESGSLVKLNEGLRPNSYLARSSPGDVARVEDRTLICSQREEDAGPTNRWVDPENMKTALNVMMRGCMKNRTMYVIPFCMGPVNSSLSEVGVQITGLYYCFF